MVAKFFGIGHQGRMQLKHKALSVHLLTATGAVLSMFAMLAAVDAEWSLMFLWLVVALIVDGIDGPLARRYEVEKNWPNYDGVLLDLIIDFLTYVFIPAFALFKSGLLPGWTGWLAIIVITYGSVIYFADTRMKTKDKSFAGFPACWNMVILVLFVAHPSKGVILAIVIALTLAMFTNLKFIHPTRTKRWRNVSLPISAIWVAMAGWAAWSNFHPPQVVSVVLIASSLYLILVGIVQQIVPARFDPNA